MTTYRIAICKTELTTCYDSNSFIRTKQAMTMVLNPVDSSDMEVISEKIDHGRKTRRFTIERAELRYLRWLPLDHTKAWDAFDVITESFAWERSDVNARGTSLRVDGTRGTAKGFYSWRPRWASKIEMPTGLAAMVAEVEDQWFGVTK